MTATLHYIQRKGIDPALASEAKRELAALNGGKNDNAVFHMHRSLTCNGKKTEAQVFAALHPAIEDEMRAATELLAREECEFPIRLQSRKHTLRKDESCEYHFIVLERERPPLNPVVLRSEGYEILGSHSLTFQWLISEVILGSAPPEEIRHKLCTILGIIRSDIKDRIGVNPSLAVDGRTIWTPDSALDDNLLDNMAKTISQHGMVGPNFVNVRDEPLTKPVYFNFHGHPGYPERWLIPPSLSDIMGSFGRANLDEGQNRICIQALSLRETTGDFKLFLRPFFRGEDLGQAVLQPLAVRIGYLNEVHNTTRERMIGEEEAGLLSCMASIIIRLKESKEVQERLNAFKGSVKEGVGQKELIAAWNGILELFEKAVGLKFIPREDWRTILWNMSGTIVA